MIRSALLLCAALLAAASFACTLPPPSPPGIVGPPKTLTACADGSAFHSHVAWLSNFDANNNGNPVNAPTAANTTPLNPMTDGAYISDLETAFSLAPPAFRQDLCGLDGIYLDTTSGPNFASCFDQ